MFIAAPSFILLYILDEVIAPAITIKAIGFLFKLNGLKSHILNKRKDTNLIYFSPTSSLKIGEEGRAIKIIDIGQKNIIWAIRKLARV